MIDTAESLRSAASVTVLVDSTAPDALRISLFLVQLSMSRLVQLVLLSNGDAGGAIGSIVYVEKVQFERLA